MIDQAPITWVDGSTALNDANFNTEIRNAYLLVMNPPTCSVHNTGTLSVPTGSTWTAQTWDTLNFDTEAPTNPMFASANPSRITVQTPGWYECVASIELFTVPAALVMTAAFRINGSTIYQGSSINATGGNLDMSPSNMIQFGTGDYIELVYVHSYTSALTIDQRGFQPILTISRRRGV